MWKKENLFSREGSFRSTLSTIDGLVKSHEFSDRWHCKRFHIQGVVIIQEGPKWISCPFLLQFQADVPFPWPCSKSGRLGVNADAKFHLAVFQAAQNTILSHIGFTLFDLLWQSQKVIRETMFKEDENKQRLLEQHSAILEAIKERDPQKARAAILAHLDFAEKKIIELTSTK